MMASRGRNASGIVALLDAVVLLDAMKGLTSYRVTNSCMRPACRQTRQETSQIKILRKTLLAYLWTSPHEGMKEKWRNAPNSSPRSPIQAGGLTNQRNLIVVSKQSSTVAGDK